MKKILPLLAFWMLTNLSVFCQNSYPKKIVLNGDTAAVITLRQVRAVNETFIKLKLESTINDSLMAIIGNYKKNETGFQSVIDSYKKIIDFKNAELAEDDKQIKDYRQNVSSQLRSVKWVRIERNVFFVAAVVLAAKVFIFK